jgi:hypothetical protein
VVEERFAYHVSVLDERHCSELSELRRDLDEHRFDQTLHGGVE